MKKTKLNSRRNFIKKSALLGIGTSLPIQSFSIQKTGNKKFPEQLGISAGQDLLKQSEGKYKKKR